MDNSSDKVNFLYLRYNLFSYEDILKTNMSRTDSVKKIYCKFRWLKNYRFDSEFIFKNIFLNYYL